MDNNKHMIIKDLSSSMNTGYDFRDSDKSQYNFQRLIL